MGGGREGCGARGAQQVSRGLPASPPSAARGPSPGLCAGTRGRGGRATCGPLVWTTSTIFLTCLFLPLRSNCRQLDRRCASSPIRAKSLHPVWIRSACAGVQTRGETMWLGPVAAGLDGAVHEPLGEAQAQDGLSDDEESLSASLRRWRRRRDKQPPGSRAPPREGRDGRKGYRGACKSGAVAWGACANALLLLVRSPAEPATGTTPSPRSPDPPSLECAAAARPPPTGQQPERREEGTGAGRRCSRAPGSASAPAATASHTSSATGTPHLTFCVSAARNGFPIVYASPGFVSLTGWTAESLVGQSCGMLLQGPATDPGAAPARWLRARMSRPAPAASSCARLDGTARAGARFTNPHAALLRTCSRAGVIRAMGRALGRGSGVSCRLVCVQAAMPQCRMPRAPPPHP